MAFREDVGQKIASVSGIGSYRIFIPDTATVPASRFRVESTGFEPHMQDAAGVKSRVVAITVEAETAEDADGACELLITGLSGFGGAMGSTRVIRCYPEDDADEEFNPELMRYGRTVKFKFLLG